MRRGVSPLCVTHWRPTPSLRSKATEHPIDDLFLGHFYSTSLAYNRYEVGDIVSSFLTPYPPIELTTIANFDFAITFTVTCSTANNSKTAPFCILQHFHFGSFWRVTTKALQMKWAENGKTNEACSFVYIFTLLGCLRN